MRQRRARASLPFGEIIDCIADAIISVDDAQRIVIFNTAAEQMFACDRRKALGQPLDCFIPERSRQVHREHLARYAASGATDRGRGTSLPLWAMRSDGTEFPVEVTISRTINGHGTFLTAILRDVSGRTADAHELDRAREQLKEREGRLEAIVQSAMDAIITIDSEQRILLFNSAAEKMFGLTSSQAMGTHLDRFIPQRFRDAHRRQVERFALTGESSRRMGVQTALVAQRADGTEFPMEASISQTTVGGQKLLTVVLRDITGRVEAERQINRASEELRALSVAMLEVRETERTRIARELHDELGQALTALKMDVELLTTTISPGRRDQLEQTAAMIGLLDATMATTRRISADLRPLVLDDLGLAAAAEWVLQSLAQRAGIDYGLAIDPACAALGEPFASALFRVMQESLTNVVRHAGATRVDVRLTRSGDEALLIIQDDGIGIEPGAPAKVGSFGLRGIQERVLLLGGKLSIAGKPNRGTTVSARIPLAAATGGSGKPR